MYPEYTAAVLAAMNYVSEQDFQLNHTDSGMQLTWLSGGAAPTPEQVIAYHDGPEYLAHVRGQRAAQLVAERQEALTARMSETWAGLSAGEVAISIAAQEPSAEVVAAYLADRQVILAAHETAVAALATMTLEQLEAAIAAGGA